MGWWGSCAEDVLTSTAEMANGRRPIRVVPGAGGVSFVEGRRCSSRAGNLY